MRPRIAIISLAAVALLGAGCGDDEGKTYPVTEEGASELARDGYAAFGSTDPARVCEVASEGLIAEVEAATEADSCEAAYEELFTNAFFKKFAAAVPKIEYGRAELGDGTASVVLSAIQDGRRVKGSIQMVEEDGGLRVEQFYVSANADAVSQPPAIG